MEKNTRLRRWQTSDTLLLNLMLAFSGGFQDAYTYMVRGHVFANAQTGNLVLMNVSLLSGEWLLFLRYLVPLVSFALGVLVAEMISVKFKNAQTLHWRQGVLILMIATMVVVGFLGERMNLLANCLVSFSCAMQVQAFRTVQGHLYASTMCIGNIRSCTVAVASWLRDKDIESKRAALDYGAVILAFSLGAGLGGLMSPRLGIQAIWVCGVILVLCWLLMWRDRRRRISA